MGISARQMRRWRKRLEEQGHKGLLDGRRGTPSRRRVAKAKADEVLSLYRDQYFDLNVRHFHEKLREDHQIGLSYTWVKQALQAAGLVKRKAKRGGIANGESGVLCPPCCCTSMAAITGGFRMSVGTI
jgi:transposase